MNRLTDKQKMTLARYVIEHVLRDKIFSLPVAKLSIIIMEVGISDEVCDTLHEKILISFSQNENQWLTSW